MVKLVLRKAVENGAVRMEFCLEPRGEAGRRIERPWWPPWFLLARIHRLLGLLPDLNKKEQFTVRYTRMDGRADYDVSDGGLFDTFAGFVLSLVESPVWAKEPVDAIFSTTNPLSRWQVTSDNPRRHLRFDCLTCMEPASKAGVSLAERTRWPRTSGFKAESWQGNGGKGVKFRNRQAAVMGCLFHSLAQSLRPCWLLPQESSGQTARSRWGFASAPNPGGPRSDKCRQ
jgi:hypothetical protein